MKIPRSFKLRPVLLLALVGSLIGFSVKYDHSGMTSMAMLPMLGLPCRKQDIDAGNGNTNGGGGPLSQEEFQSKVLAGVTEVRNQHKVIDENFTKLDAESKKLSTDFANHVKAFEGMPSQIIEVQRTLQAIQMKANHARSEHFGSAIQRIGANEDLCRVVAGIAKGAANKKGGSFAISEPENKGAGDYARAMAEASAPGSSYINAELIPLVYALIAEYGIWSGFDVQRVGTNVAKLIVDTTDPVMSWTAENTASSEASYSGSVLSATIGKMLGWIQVPNELMEDSVINLATYLLKKFANATGYRLDYTALQGAGTANTTEGGFTGIFSGGTASVSTTTHTTIATTTVDDFLACMAAVNSAVLTKPGAAWWIHPTNVVRMLGVKDLNGRPIFLPSVDAPSFGAIGSILGFPVRLSHAAPSANTTSSKIAAFGDPDGCAIALRSDFDFAMSEHVKFTEDGVVFRARARAAVKVKTATAFGILTNAAS